MSSAQSARATSWPNTAGRPARAADQPLRGIGTARRHRVALRAAKPIERTLAAGARLAAPRRSPLPWTAAPPHGEALRAPARWPAIERDAT
jgi:hypothetical protein